MHETGCLALVHWDDPEGWDREGGERGFRMGSTYTPMADSCQCMAKPLQYCKVISLQFKKKKIDGIKWPWILMSYSLQNFNLEEADTELSSCHM